MLSFGAASPIQSLKSPKAHPKPVKRSADEDHGGRDDVLGEPLGPCERWRDVAFERRGGEGDGAAETIDQLHPTGAEAEHGVARA